MSKDELINEIVRRVMAKIAEYEKNNNCSSGSNTVSVNNNNTCACNNSVNNNTNTTARVDKETHVDKRLLSERDVIDACTSGINIVYYSKKTIVTDLAKDYARAHKVQLVKE